MTKDEGQRTKGACWKDRLDARQWAEVELARTYVRHYNHGTAGHNRLQLIALLADLLDEAHAGQSQE